uniref:Uncharacterized protein n=1 Tax=Taeniopygia guttata TaxID=59729 RepID=A0A674G977_TAEGU
MLLNPQNSPQISPKFPPILPKSPKILPKISQISPKFPPDPPKSTKFPQIHTKFPKFSQNSPQNPQNSPKSPPKFPQIPPKSPKIPQISPNFPQTPSKSPKLPPKFPTFPPKFPQNSPKSPPKFPQTPPKFPQIPPKPSKLLPNFPQIPQISPNSPKPPKFPLRYYRFNEALGAVDPDYPKSIEVWGVPPGPRGAFMGPDEAFTYFYRSHLYWKFDNSALRPLPGHPKSALRDWLNCPSPAPPTPPIGRDDAEVIVIALGAGPGALAAPLALLGLAGLLGGGAWLWRRRGGAAHAHLRRCQRSLLPRV